MNFSATQLRIRSERFLIADQVIAVGGSLSKFARRAGLSPAGALKWLRHHSPERLAKLTAAPAPNALTPHEILVRLLWLQAVDGMRGHQKRVCRIIGVSAQSLAHTRKTWAPDGLDAAIADLMPDEAEAAHV